MSEQAGYAMNVRMIVGGEGDLPEAVGLALDPDEDVIVGYVPGTPAAENVDRAAELTGYPMREPLVEFGRPPHPGEADLFAYTRRRVIFSALGKAYNMSAEEVAEQARTDPDWPTLSDTPETQHREAMDAVIGTLVADGLLEVEDGDGGDWDARFWPTGRLEEVGLDLVSAEDRAVLLKAKLMHMADTDQIDDELAAWIRDAFARGAGSEEESIELHKALQDPRVANAMHRIYAMRPTDLTVDFDVHRPRHGRAA